MVNFEREFLQAWQRPGFIFKVVMSAIVLTGLGMLLWGN